MISIEYCKGGEAVSDFEVEQWFPKILEYAQLPTWVNGAISTTPPLDRIRQAIAEGELDHNKVCFVFNGKEIKVNQYGAVQDWTNGFCDTGVKISEKILRAAMKTRKIERNKALDELQ